MASRDMTLTELKHTTKAFDDTHTVSVKGFKDSDKITAAYVLKELRASIALVLNEMRKGFAQVNARIDNLVVKNDLKE